MLKHQWISCDTGIRALFVAVIWSDEMDVCMMETRMFQMLHIKTKERSENPPSDPAGSRWRQFLPTPRERFCSQASFSSGDHLQHAFKRSKMITPGSN